MSKCAVPDPAKSTACLAAGRRFRIAILTAPILAAALAVEPPASGQQVEKPLGLWKLETVILSDDTQVLGLIQGESAREIDFAQILQPAGKPMYAVVRGIPRDRVKSLDRLPESEHAELAARLAAFRHRTLIEAGRLEEVTLRRVDSASEPNLRHYEGPWFSLRSTADDDQTRRAVVRIEQLFRGFRTLLPPRTEVPPNLAVQLDGSLDQYQARVRQMGLALENAAFYAPRHRTIYAGSELNRIGQRMAEVQARSEQIQQDLVRLDREQAKVLAATATQLKTAGYDEDEIAGELRQRKAAWKKQQDSTRAANRESLRIAEAKVREATATMYRSLAHEAFHAWVDLFAFPGERESFPRWLNEGLAQVFEASELDGDSLRLDALDPVRHRTLAEDLRLGQPLRLVDVLRAGEQEFLGPHGSGAPQRHYLYAWGLAHYLTFQQNLLASERLAEYVDPGSDAGDPVAQFERLVGRPLAEFEAEWQQAMLADR
jgi:hypothetical protein